MFNDAELRKLAAECCYHQLIYEYRPFAIKHMYMFTHQKTVKSQLRKVNFTVPTGILIFLQLMPKQIGLPVGNGASNETQCLDTFKTHVYDKK